MFLNYRAVVPGPADSLRPQCSAALARADNPDRRHHRGVRIHQTRLSSIRKAGIVAGHARLEAARSLSLPEVPVIVLDHLSDVQKRAYILADNKLAESATWEDELLRIELDALKTADFDVSLTGFSAAEIDVLLQSIESPNLTDEDDTPAPDVRVVTQLGDVWELGPHRIVCGDALNGGSCDALLGGQPADMVFTD